MKHEVKIPSDCKATVSIEDRRILIIIDQKEDILVAGTNHIQASAGQFVKSDAGYIAMTGEQNYTVVLTPSGEIQLNQSCNFPITIPAKFNDADKLMSELAKQKALMIAGKELVKWRPAKLACEPFSAINSVWKAKTYLSMEDALMDDLLLADNIFPPGFLTEEKISQFKKTIMDLFDSWRQ